MDFREPEQSFEPINHQPENDSWINPTDEYFMVQLQEILGPNMENYPRIVETLRQAADFHKKEPLKITIYNGENQAIKLPTDPTYYHYHQTLFTTSETSTAHNTPHLTTLGGSITYRLREEERRLAPIKFVAIDQTGHIKEICFGSEEVLQQFLYHFYGRQLTEEEKLKLQQVHADVFEYLRSIPECKEKLDLFVNSRGWPEHLDLAAKSGIVYLHDKYANLKDWAAAKGYTPEEMQLAGWFEVNFTNSGQANYSVRDSNVIRIPYYDTQGNIILWRTRTLDPKKAIKSKYTSFPKNRSLTEEGPVEGRLYNAWKLPEVKGKPLIITEGEFKCLVSTEMTNIISVGIPGITEIDEGIYQAVVAAQPSEVIVILDRDQKGKGLMRVDGITDSARAAYSISHKLEQLGIETYVAILPNIFGGGKVGLDDYLLEVGGEGIHQLIQSKLTPTAYATEIGLNLTFYETMSKRNELRRLLEAYKNSASRGGKLLEPEIVNTIEQIYFDLDQLYRKFLMERLQGAIRIDQPVRDRRTLYQKQYIRNQERKYILTNKGNEIPLEYFKQDMIMMEFYPLDVSEKDLWPLAFPAKLPYWLNEIDEFLTGKEIINPHLTEALEAGINALSLNITLADCRNLSREEIVQLLTVHQLLEYYPLDEFEYEYNVSLLEKKANYWAKYGEIPIIVRRKGRGTVVAIANFVQWDSQTPQEKASELYQRSGKNKYILKFLRSSLGENVPANLERFQNTLWPYWFERNLTTTTHFAAKIGISSEIVKHTGMLYLRHGDFTELIKHLVNNKLLNQALGLGLLKWGELEMIPAFEGDIVIIPDYNFAVGHFGIRILPLNIDDFSEQKLVAKPQLALIIDAGAKSLSSGESVPSLFMERNLELIDGKPLIVTMNELDSLIVRGMTESVVGLNGTLEINQLSIEKIAHANISELVFIIPELNYPSKYDSLNFDGIPGFMKEILEIQARIRQAGKRIPFKVIVLDHPVAEYRHQNKATNFISESILLDEYLEAMGFNSELHSVIVKFHNILDTLIEYLEISAFGNFINLKPAEYYMNNTRRLYNAISGQVASAYNSVLPSLDKYIQQFFKLDYEIDIEAMFRERYNHGTTHLFRQVIDEVNNSNPSKHIELEFVQKHTNYLNPKVASQPIVNMLPAKPRKPYVNSESKRESHYDFAFEDPISYLNEIVQKFPAKFSPPQYQQENLENNLFVAEVQLRIEGELISITLPHELATIKAKHAKSRVADLLLKQISDQIAAAIEISENQETQKLASVTTKDVPQDIEISPLDNPIGTINELHQKSNGYISSPQYQDTQLPNGKFISKLSLSVGTELKEIELPLELASTKKKEARTLVSNLFLQKYGSDLSQKIEQFETALVAIAPAPETKDQTDYKGLILNLIAKNPQRISTPTYNIEQHSNGLFGGKAYINVNQNTYSVDLDVGYRRKAQAEMALANLIWNLPEIGMFRQEIVTPAINMDKIDSILRHLPPKRLEYLRSCLLDTFKMFKESKDYISPLSHFKQKATLGKLKYEEVVSPLGNACRLSLNIDQVPLEVVSEYHVSYREAKHEAANLMLNKIYNLLFAPET